MRPATPAVVNFLANWNPRTPASIPELYTFTLVGGEVLRYASSQEAIMAPLPNTSSPLVGFSRGPKFTRLKTKVQIGVQVDELEIDIDAGENDLIGTLTWQEALHL